MNQIAKFLKEKGGYQLVESKTLGETIAFALMPYKKILEKQGYIVYLPSELNKLRGCSKEELTALHEIKKRWKGEIYERSFENS